MEKAVHDVTLKSLLAAEQERQEHECNLIASENYASPAVLEASASVATNKYAEGYPGHRYYAGCAIVDKIEQIAIERAKKLFNAEHVNVQPHAGSQANLAVYYALLKPGDTILGMSLAEGGHLTHGHKVNFSGRLFNSVQYKVDPTTECLDYDEIERIALETKPKLIICGASAYARTIDFARFSAIAAKVDAYLLADIAHIAGLIAAGLHPNPFPHADVVTTTTHKTLRGPRGGMIMCKQAYAQEIDKAVMPGTQGGPFMHAIAAKAVAFHEALQPEFVTYQKQVIANAQALAAQLETRGYRMVTGGTDNHLLVVDVRSKQINGLIAEQVLQKIGITASRSCIPFDPEKPWITSGIRFGTPAITTRGMGTTEMADIAAYIDQAIMQRDNPETLEALRNKVMALCKAFPIYEASWVDTSSVQKQPTP